MKRFVLRSLSGLEPVVVAEVRLRFHHKARWIGPREVVVEVSEDESAATAAQLVQLATVDDAFLELATSGPASKSKAGIVEILALLDAVEARSAARLVLDWRGVSWPEELWVTASVLGGRRYSRFDVEDAVGPILAAKVGAAYRSQREGSRTEFPVLAFRLTVDERRNALLLRLAHRPLHRRLYWRQTRQGALYPPLAAAMGMLADLQPGNVVLDPFCGAGTIPIEIHRLVGDRVSVIASDIAHDAMMATRKNAIAASAPRIGLFRADVSWMPIGAHSIDRIVANPPWNRQVTWLRQDAGAWFNEILREEGRLVLLELAPDAVKLGRLPWSAATLPVSLRGQHPVITVYGPERRPVAAGMGDGRSIPLHEVTRTLPSVDAWKGLD